jgi:hypothetical protein
MARQHSCVSLQSWRGIIANKRRTTDTSFVENPPIAGGPGRGGAAAGRGGAARGGLRGTRGSGLARAAKPRGAK